MDGSSARNYGLLNTRVKIIVFTDTEDYPKFLLFYRNTPGGSGYEFVNEGYKEADVPESARDILHRISCADDIGKQLHYRTREEERKMSYTKNEMRASAARRALEEELFRHIPGYGQSNQEEFFREFVRKYEFLPPFRHVYSNGEPYVINTMVVSANPEILTRGGNDARLENSDEHKSMHLLTLGETIRRLRYRAFKNNTDDLKSLLMAIDGSVSNIVEEKFSDLTRAFRRRELLANYPYAAA